MSGLVLATVIAGHTLSAVIAGLDPAIHEAGQQWKP
jgi:hypothetical protein